MRIELPGQSPALAGALPAELAELTQLTHLDLSGNAIAGGIPSGIGTLTALETLALEANVLTGTLPSALGDLAQLQTLTVSGNMLTGSVPSDEPHAPQSVWTELSRRNRVPDGRGAQAVCTLQVINT